MTILIGLGLIAPSTASAETAPARPSPGEEAGNGPAKDPRGGARGEPHREAPPDDEDESGVAPQGHGGGQSDGAMGGFQPPKDGSVDDPSLPKGTLSVSIADPTGKPLPSTPVTLGVLYNSIAKGDSRKRLSATTNERGVATFEHLDMGSGVAYRPMVLMEGATFAVMPFRLSETSGMRAILHVYPVVESIDAALVVSQSILFTEVKDDRIQIQQAFKIYNFGKNAWVPKDLVVPLPENFTAFSTQQGMTDVGADAVPKQGVRIHGTFAPGQHMIEFRWQLPYNGESEVGFDVGVAPHTAASRVIAPASKDMKLDVAGFPTPQSTSDESGQRSLVTERQLKRDEAPLKTISVMIKGLPTEGPAKFIATLVAGAGLAFGIYLGSRKHSSRDRSAERSRLLAELEDLERARRAGDIGPKTYERTRREVVDALARTLSDEAAAHPKKSRTATA